MRYPEDGAKRSEYRALSMVLKRLVPPAEARQGKVMRYMHFPLTRNNNDSEYNSFFVGIYE
eukprot:scaffold11_cov142-Amphora_coffeaeformis.AAC.3